MHELALSISLPNYNHANYLPERIPSVLNALPNDAELIIVDDGSTDGSKEIIAKFAKKDSRLIYIDFPENRGVIATLNTILSHARGKFISFQSSDDFISPNFFSKMLVFAKEFPGYPIYISNAGYCINEIPKNPAQLMGGCLLGSTSKKVHLFSNRELIKKIRKGFWIPGHASIMDTKQIKARGGFDPQLDHHADWYLFLSIAFECGVAYLCETLSYWRMDEGSSYSTDGLKDQIRRESVQNRIFERLATKENRKLKRNFMFSGLLFHYAKERFFYLLTKPKHWDLVLHTLYIGFNRKVNKHLLLKKF